MALSVMAGLVGCGRSGYPAGAPVITVATGLFPLAQIVEQVAQGQVHVLDVVPPGRDPRTYTLTDAEARAVRRAALVVEVGGGFQPSFEQAAAGGRRVLALRSALRTADPRLWLDPGLVQRAGRVVAAAMSRANPPATAWYGDGARAFTQAMASLDIDYHATLAPCPDRTFFAPDGAFDGLARRYGLRVTALGTRRDPAPAAVSAGAAAVRASGVAAVFSEPWVPAATVRAVAAEAGVRVRVLDTLEGPPPGGWPPHVTYADLMEANLGALSGALHCPSVEGMTS